MRLLFVTICYHYYLLLFDTIYLLLFITICYYLVMRLLFVTIYLIDYYYFTICQKASLIVGIALLKILPSVFRQSLSHLKIS